MVTADTNSLRGIQARDRLLLLPHCLRPSETCTAKQTRDGLLCPPGCDQKCLVAEVRAAAQARGYGAVCVASGGAMALRSVRAHQPRGIVAAACEKELALGVEGVRGLAQELDWRMPPIAVIPLTKDGCIDTELDIEEALRVLSLGLDGAPVDGDVGNLVWSAGMSCLPPEPEGGSVSVSPHLEGNLNLNSG